MAEKRIEYLDSIRGIAGLSIMMAHLLTSYAIIGVNGSGTGKINVCLFFVLSGYLFGISKLDKDINLKKDVYDFYVNKFLRIVPCFLVTIIVAILLNVIDSRTAFDSLTMKSVYGHLWYIPVILGFYLIAPLLGFLISKKVPNICKIVGLLTIGIVFAIVFPYTQCVENSIKFWYYLPVFIMGMVLVVLNNVICNKLKRQYVYDIICIFIVLGFIIAIPGVRYILFNIPADGYLQNKYIFMGLAWTVFLFCVGKSKIIKDLLDRFKLGKWLGQISYPLYLVHFIILVKVNQYIGSIGKFVIVIVSSIVLAWILHITIEKNIDKLRKGNKKNIVFGMVVLLYALLTIACFYRYNSFEQNLADSEISTEEVKTENVVAESWEQRLYVPTSIQKYGDTYFIVDCWNHRVIYSDSLEKDISEWSTMTDESYVGGHTIASDGDIYVLDNTDNSQVIAYRENISSGGFVKIKTIGNIEGRPHYVVYDEIEKKFYVIGSTSGKLYVFENRNGILMLTQTVDLEEIKNSYVRSISIIDGNLYTVCGNNAICEYSIEKNSFTLLNSYEIQDDFYGMNQITKIQDYFYITVNTDKNGDISKTDIIRVNDLNDIANNNYESIYTDMKFVGQPYYINEFDDKYYITQISETKGNGIKTFEVVNNDISNVSDVYYWENVLDVSISRYNSKYALPMPLSNQTVDLFIFCGQSNMSGKGNAMLSPRVEVGYEFRAITDSANLYNIYEPFGINQNNSNGVNDIWTDTQELRKQGGMVSAFANSYYDNTGVPIVGVSCSEGATTIDQWQVGTSIYNDIVYRSNLAKEYLKGLENVEVRHTYMVWCQGESDGDVGTSSDEYYNELKNITDTLVADGIIEKCMIVRTGNNGDVDGLYDDIINAQDRLCKDSDNCIMISTLATSFKEKGLMQDMYHYTQEGYNLLGEDAGLNAAQCSNEMSE